MARTTAHVAIHCGERIENSRRAVVQEHRLDLGIKATVLRVDYRTRHVFLYDNSDWVVASYDVDHCRDWEWERDRVYVYDDDHHPGWYLLFNARLGRYVHVEYFGVH